MTCSPVPGITKRSRDGDGTDCEWSCSPDIKAKVGLAGEERERGRERERDGRRAISYSSLAAAAGPPHAAPELPGRAAGWLLHGRLVQGHATLGRLSLEPADSTYLIELEAAGMYRSRLHVKFYWLYRASLKLQSFLAKYADFVTRIMVAPPCLLASCMSGAELRKWGRYYGCLVPSAWNRYNGGC